MKRNVLIGAFLLILVLSLGLIVNTNNDKQWSKINNYIYIDKSSVIKDGNTASGWFKIYNSPENKLYKINDIDVYYRLNKYEIECSGQITVSIAHSKSYDKNNNLLDEYINEQGYACLYPCLINDEIYVRELCK